MTQAPKANALLDELNRFLDEAEAHLAKGGDLDLAGVETQVKDLCEAAENLPVGQGAAFARELEALFARFSHLQDELKVQFESVKGELASLSLRSKAVKAYAVNDALKPPKKDEK